MRFLLQFLVFFYPSSYGMTASDVRMTPDSYLLVGSFLFSSFGPLAVGHF